MGVLKDIGKVLGVIGMYIAFFAMWVVGMGIYFIISLIPIIIVLWLFGVI